MKPHLLHSKSSAAPLLHSLQLSLSSYGLPEIPITVFSLLCRSSEEARVKSTGSHHHWAVCGQLGFLTTPSLGDMGCFDWMTGYTSRLGKFLND